MAKDNSTQEQIQSQWVVFSKTEAFKDYMSYLKDTQNMLQDYVDNMVEPRPSAIPGLPTKQPIDSEKANILNQRKVGVRLAQQYIDLRLENS